MIKLIDILYEAKQRGTLYHFTDGIGLMGILKTNELLASEDVKHVSLTRDKQAWYVGTLDNAFRISLDGDKISNKYKIIPYAWSGGDRGTGETESEEAVLTDKITNIRDYIIDIVANKEVIDMFRDTYGYMDLDGYRDLYPNLKIIAK
jgi:hypothetical protein